MFLLNSYIVNLKRLCHLVLESADKMLENFPKQTETILNITQSMLQHRIVNYSIQIILVGETWSMNLENMIRKLETLPFVCIGTHLEAALYGRTDIKLHFVPIALKKAIISGNFKFFKIHLSFLNNLFLSVLNID